MNISAIGRIEFVIESNNKKITSYIGDLEADGHKLSKCSLDPKFGLINILFAIDQSTYYLKVSCL